MIRYILRRLPQMILTVFFITIITFWLMHLAPGDPIDLLILTNPNITPAEIQHMKALYGFDKPIYVQYFRWLGQLLRGDLGYSRLFHLPITRILPPRLMNTIILTGLGLLISVFIAVPIGIYSALKQYSWLDYVLSILAFLGISLPVFWFALVLILLFSVQLGWLPPGGHYSLEPAAPLLAKVRYLVMPVLVLSLFSTASWMRYMRSSMLEVIRQEYIVTARAKGLRERMVIWRHALRNALIPIVTLIALSIPGLISGAVITETIFAWPGMGRLIFDSLMNNDYSLAMGIFLLFSILVVFFNLLADIVYTLLDPRITYE